MGVNVVPLDRMCPQNEHCKSADVFLFIWMKRNADTKWICGYELNQMKIDNI